MRKILIAFSLVTLSLTGFAQQDKQLTHFFFNNVTTNPGAAGTNDNICFGLTLRNQWTGFPGNPKTGAFTFSTGLTPHNGIGMVVIADQLGASSDFTFKGSYSRHFLFSGGRSLSIGVNGGFISKGINFNQFSNGGVPTYVDITDPYLAGQAGLVSVLKPDLGAGIYYKAERLYFGVSGQELLAGTLKYNAGGANFAQSHIARHYYLTGGYTYPLNAGTTRIDLKPSFLLKSDLTATQFDFNLLAEINSAFWVGATYRYQDAATALLGAFVPVGDNKLRIGYAYDFTTSGLGEPKQGGSNGSHEIYLGYCIKKPVPPVVKYWDPTWGY